MWKGQLMDSGASTVGGKMRVFQWHSAGIRLRIINSVKSIREYNILV